MSESWEDFRGENNTFIDRNSISFRGYQVVLR